MKILLILLLAPQDLLERARRDVTPRTTVSSDRLDLRIGPTVDRSSTTVRPGTVGLNLDFIPDLACGRFDLNASFKSIFTKNMRDELLGQLVDWGVSELTHSAMVLACQMSPTVCDAMKHYRVTAQDFLNMQLDQCRSIEELAGGSDRQRRAGASKECLERFQAQGMTLDEAMRRCQEANQLRGLRGQPVQEIDLVREVTEALGLSGDSRDLLRQFVDNITLSTTRVGGEVKVRPVDDRYERTRQEYAKALTDATAAAQRGPVPQTTLDRLAPPGTPRVTNEELQRLSAMDPVDRDLTLSMLAAAVALAKVVREAADVQAALSSARAMATDPTLQQAIDGEARRIDEEVRRLKEAFEMDALVTQARLRADAAAMSRSLERARQNTAGWRERDRQTAATQATQEWGKACPTKK